MHTMILVCEDLITLPDDEAFERPVSGADLKFPASGIFNFIKSTYYDLPQLYISHSVALFSRTTTSLQARG